MDDAGNAGNGGGDIVVNAPLNETHSAMQKIPYKILAIVLGLAILAGIGVGVYFLVKKRRKSRVAAAVPMAPVPAVPAVPAAPAVPTDIENLLAQLQDIKNKQKAVESAAVKPPKASNPAKAPQRNRPAPAPAPAATPAPAVPADIANIIRLLQDIKNKQKAVQSAAPKPPKASNPVKAPQKNRPPARTPPPPKPQPARRPNVNPAPPALPAPPAPVPSPAPPSAPAQPGFAQLGIPPIPFQKGGAWNINSIPKGSKATITQNGDALQVVYPANCGGLGKCGSKAGMNIRASPSCCFPCQAIQLSYDVFFDSNFNFQEMGKLPGIWIGDKGASGGTWKEHGGSVRVMWRVAKNKDAGAVAYCYIPTEVGGSKERAIAKQNIPMESHGSTGADLFRAAKKQPPIIPLLRNQWNAVSLTVELNMLGASNGSVTLSVNGVSKTQGGMTWRTTDLKINGIVLSSWFGGSSPTTRYGSSKDERALFRNFTIRKLS